MSEPDASRAELGERPPEFHLGRIALGLYLDLVDFGRDRRDLIGPLIEAAVLQANASAYVEARIRTGDFDALREPVPARAMRPVSVSGVAASLGLPFETVRRRVGGLVRKGCVVRERQGLRMAPARLARPEARLISLLRHERLQWLYRDIRDNLGEAALGLPGSPAPTRPTPLLALTDHLSNEYMLRLALLFTNELGDPFVGFVFLNILRANIRHLPLDDLSLDPRNMAARRPARPTPLSKILGLPQETLRRQILRLEEAGFVDRVEGGGMILDERALRGPFAHALIPVAIANVRRMLGQMARAGLLPSAARP